MIHRRQVLTAAGAALALAPVATLAQTAADAPAPAAADAADKLIAAFTGSAEPAEAGVTLTAPEISENGNTVPISVGAPGASAILGLAPANPLPQVATFTFGALAGSQKASTRIRLTRTEDVIAVAKLADGSFGKAQASIKVTIGGCGG